VAGGALVHRDDTKLVRKLGREWCARFLNPVVDARRIRTPDVYRGIRMLSSREKFPAENETTIRGWLPKKSQNSPVKSPI
jgi:hypothetical protein